MCAMLLYFTLGWMLLALAFGQAVASWVILGGFALGAVIGTLKGFGVPR